MIKTKELIEKKLKEVPVKAKILTRKALEGKASPRGAIKAFCLECVGYERKEIIFCTAPCCPLYEYRPKYQLKQTKDSTISPTASDSEQTDRH